MSHEIAARPKAPPLTRRTVFVGAGTVGALAAVAAVLPRDPALAAAAPTAAHTDAASPRGYHLSEHVQAYYKTARV